MSNIRISLLAGLTRFYHTVQRILQLKSHLDDIFFNIFLRALLQTCVDIRGSCEGGSYHQIVFNFYYNIYFLFLTYFISLCYYIICIPLFKQHVAFIIFSAYINKNGIKKARVVIALRDIGSKNVVKKNCRVQTVIMHSMDINHATL